MIARLRRVLARESGYSLMELLTVLLILSTVLGALTSLFVQASTAELDMNRRFQAQQQARTAVDRMRREIHCASAVANPDGTPVGAAPVAAVRITLPAQCPTAGGAVANIVYDTFLVSSGRYQLRRAGVRIADYVTASDIFSYTAASPASRATLHVDLPINIDATKTGSTWRLVADIVLRNTARA